MRAKPSPNLPTTYDDLKKRLSHASEINITVTGRKSGRPVSIPVWFVFEEGTLYLLPVKGSDTQWYKNVLKNPIIRIESGSAGAEVKIVPRTDSAQVESIVEKFRRKHGDGDVRKYYSKFDVAVVADIR